MGSDKIMVDDFNEHEDDELGTGLSILSFCIPVAGAVIWLSNKSDKPNKAKQACHAALWGALVGFVVNVIARLID